MTDSSDCRRGRSRRRFLALAGGSTVALAGCLEGSDGGATDGSGSDGTGDSDGTSAGGGTGDGGEDLPDGIYVQPFRETMSMQGTQESGPYGVAFMYAAPHRFWQVSGSDTTETPRDGDVHAMAVPWHPETNRVVPETGLTLEIMQDGDLVSQEVIYPMLSQRMGYHYGGNFGLDGDGEYVATVTVGAVPDGVRLTGDYEGLFREPVTVEIPFAFDDEERAKVESEELEAYGEQGAVEPTQMDAHPTATGPSEGELPGEFLADTTSDEARFLTAVLREPPERFAADTYLATFARTRYNGLVLPGMSVEATVTRDGSAVFEGGLARTFDAEFGYHYGAGLEDGLESGDEVELRVPVPPQVARHEGYERAFLEMEPMTFTV
jgi:hypothetical protein